MSYTIYNPTTGQIQYTIFGGQINLDSLIYVEGAYNDKEHYIDISTKTPITKPVKPSIYHNWDITNKTWVLDDIRLINNIRLQRNQLLTAIDRVNPVWYSTLTADQQTELQTYRTALLNVPQQSGFPETITWPNKPAWL